MSGIYKLIEVWDFGIQTTSRKKNKQTNSQPQSKLPVAVHPEHWQLDQGAGLLVGQGRKEGQGGVHGQLDSGHQSPQDEVVPPDHHLGQEAGQASQGRAEGLGGVN